MIRKSFLIRGHVQGVGFRYFVKQEAGMLGITGWVRNTPRGDVELEAQASGDTILHFQKLLQKGPPSGRVDDVICSEQVCIKDEKNFEIRF